MAKPKSRSEGGNFPPFDERAKHLKKCEEPKLSEREKAASGFMFIAGIVGEEP